MINALVAVDKNQGIGYQGKMPWPYLKGDMNWFKTVTDNQIIIMGSTTYDSIGKLLPNRINVVISSKRYLGDHTFNNCLNAISFCNVEYPDKEIFIIGGGTIYKTFMNLIQKFYVTEIDEEYLCDTFFNLDYVQKHFTNVRELAIFNEPVKYTIKEYS